MAFDNFKYVAEDHIIGALNNYQITYKNPPRAKLMRMFLNDMM